MRKTLIAVAFASAAVAPAAAVTAAATFAPAAAIAAPKASTYKPGTINPTSYKPTTIKAVRVNDVRRRNLRLKRNPLVRRPGFDLAARCVWPRVSIRRETLRLRHAGFRQVRYQGRRVFRPRCALFLTFSACKRGKRYQVTVRYIRLQRYVITQYRGWCVLRAPVLRNPS